MELPIDTLIDDMTDAELRAFAEDAELVRKGDEFLAALEAEKLAGVVFVI